MADAHAAVTAARERHRLQDIGEAFAGMAAALDGISALGRRADLGRGGGDGSEAERLDRTEVASKEEVKEQRQKEAVDWVLRLQRKEESSGWFD